ncbi:16S rRNA (uracil(1498)-N(3))-methyltransferase [Desulfuribacillus alkaliarsenatis]|uniref:Ribosomal RNA small subunit methyltransferase E n=1 Tax=Desulfuribacillus alkaliarsenatis TaxID=766136 RepID=A0A1E5G091_9FIRM|nr:16S rRNA (uracil(1498)-N(3))-methyltransferase [Desulfuribacillus alkaliarsenatis]OEF96234.1 hypothetical protein BHF68_08705 [Desulfuribacillus alkaliarsenatis]
MQRYFVDGNRINNNNITIDGDDAKHIIKVMRSEIGDKVICVSPEGDNYITEIINFDKNQVKLTVVEQIQDDNEPTINITLYQGLTKADKFEWIIQKGTEIGITSFVPVEMKYSVAKWDASKGEKKLERWQKIAKEAAEQSHRSKVPAISSALTFPQLLKSVSKHSLTMLAYEKSEHSQGIFALLKQHPEIKDFAIIIGPEGGVSEQEKLQAVNAGVKLINLGPRILRTETAGIVAATGVLFYHQQLGES